MADKFVIGEEKVQKRRDGLASGFLRDTHEAYDFAYVCAYHAMVKCGIAADERKALYDDCLQEVVVVLMRCDGRSRNYAFKAGYNAALSWLNYWLYGDKSHRQTKVYPEHTTYNEFRDTTTLHEAHPPEPKEEEIPGEVGDLLAEIMLSARKQKRGRAVTAAYRDANIILLSLQGFSAENIADFLDDKVENIRIYRRNARRLIQEYLEKEFQS